VVVDEEALGGADVVVGEARRVAGLRVQRERRVGDVEVERDAAAAAAAVVVAVVDAHCEGAAEQQHAHQEVAAVGHCGTHSLTDSLTH
jgi:hypothetical protein